MGRELLQGLWRQEIAREICRDGLVAEGASSPKGASAFGVPSAFGSSMEAALRSSLWLELDAATSAGDVLFDTVRAARRARGRRRFGPRARAADRRVRRQSAAHGRRMRG